LVEADVEDSAEANVPLGILDASTYTRQRVKLAQGDLLVLYTDALMEATSKAGTTLGTRGLLAMAQQLDGRDVGKVTTTLMERVRAFAGGELDDDATIMVLTRNSIPTAKGSLATGLATTARLAKDLIASMSGKKTFAWPEVRVDNVLGAYFERFNKR
jgi:hypothetical protein